jgi:hypothetical protein
MNSCEIYCPAYHGLIMDYRTVPLLGKSTVVSLEGYFKGTVSPVSSWLKEVWLNVVESGEGPLVVFRFYLRSVNL